MATYLITGGCGFIGRHLTQHLLSQGHQVRIIDNLTTSHANDLPTAVDFIQGDCRSQLLLEEYLRDADGVFHLAALNSLNQKPPQGITAHEMNFGSTFSLLNCLQRIDRQRAIKLVYASTAEVYGNPGFLQVSEDHPTTPLNSIGSDKRCSELQIQQYSREYGIASCILRLFNVYGPGAATGSHSDSDSVVSRFACSLVQGRPLLIEGSGHQIRDYLYIDDAVGMLSAAMSIASEQAPLLNACTGCGHSTNEVARLLSQLHHGINLVMQAPTRASAADCLIGSPQRINQVLGLTSLTPLALGSEKTLTRYQGLLSQLASQQAC
ncbi:NAD-dependent epimerase/dehydratase family protein [Pseudomonas anguilliseptica]|uniref:NAD-dependent epimerase/dehydratase family protein n=1 Tax=Pseudomonas anguilliseptica TaxID=53406 RepID=UPI00325C02D8